MNPIFYRVAAAVGAPLLLAGCLSTPTVTPTRYYTLNVAPHAETGTPTGKTLGIRPLASARPYKLEVAYKNDPNRLAYFPRAEWAETPATVVNRALMDNIRSLGMFDDVGDAADMARPDYILTGELRRFEADYTTAEARAVVEVAIAIRSTDSPGTLWEGLVTAETPLPPSGESADNVDVIAQAMSDAVSALVAKVCAQLTQ